MRNWLFILLTLHIGITNAQITTYQLCLKDSTLNILYPGFDNYVIIKNLPEGAKVIFKGQVLDPLIYPSAPPDLYNLIFWNGSDSVLYVYKNDNEIYSKVFTIKHFTN